MKKNEEYIVINKLNVINTSINVVRNGDGTVSVASNNSKYEVSNELVKVKIISGMENLELGNVVSFSYFINQYKKDSSICVLVKINNIYESLNEI